MKLPRVRFTTNRLMVAVALVGLLAGGWAWGERRRAHFLALADEHREGEIRSMMCRGVPPRERWHGELRVKYERAARCPWLPVAPDPPDPGPLPTP